MIRNFFNYLRFLPKSVKFTVVAALAALVVATPIVTQAGWWPARPVKDYNNLADRFGFDHPVFNSFINTPFYGDERAFFDSRHATDTASGSYADVLTNVQPGEELMLRTYVHNNANQDFNASGQGVARNTKVRVHLPTGTGNSLQLTSFISADNATPGVVSDTTELKGDQPFSLEYVPGSAEIATAGAANGAKLSDSIVTSGAPIGFNAINGDMPGCFEFQALVFLKVKVKAPALQLEKQVALEGQPFGEQVAAKTGDKVTWLLSYKNAGTQQIDNVDLIDTLPAGVTLVPGSVSLTDAAHPSGLSITDGDLFDANGVNAGSYTAGSNGFIKFKTTINDSNTLPKCGDNVLTNVVTASADHIPPMQDDASVVVNKECVPPEVPPEQPPTQVPGQPLPVTGPAETAAFSLLGSGGLGVAIRRYLRSRKDLTTALLDA